ncbi:MAG: hypothetical protein J6A42_00020 [Firmicutes bacterium]|nr:hypothetical protein [Bacillota bacterium]
MELKVLKGGKSSSLITEYRFAGGEITNTRLMGVLGMHLHWLLPYETENRDLHQFYYYDIEELGLESMGVYIGDDEIAVEVTAKSIFGGLGAEMKPLTEREARYLAGEMIAETKRKNQLLPEEARDLDFITKAPVLLTEEEKEALNRKMCVPIRTDYGVVNYYLMRLYGKDPEGAALLVAKGADPEVLTISEPRRHCTFLRNSIQDNGGVIRRNYLCESLIEVDDENAHRIVTSEVSVAGGKVVAAQKKSEFRISDYEASMKLSRPEFVTVYEIYGDMDSFDADFAPYVVGAQKTGHDCGDMYMEFKRDNYHVDQPEFMLSDDVQTLYFVTDYGQLIVGAYSLEDIVRAEALLQTGRAGKHIQSTAKYQFADPIIYEFAMSGMTDFTEFLKALD